MIAHEAELELLHEVQHFPRVRAVPDNVSEKYYTRYVVPAQIEEDGAEGFEVCVYVGKNRYHPAAPGLVRGRTSVNAIRAAPLPDRLPPNA